ncbi:hypothetical protein C2G38_21798 [Gigaspora rosea]|uniref:Uncharacterized protein n=1 Tax=Gigaspora rosea TaxID=44941 RepID=A0A397VXN9_9GLOM|nr:hypothetical protein C2G38_21798 [Gigaspora rosea]
MLKNRIIATFIVLFAFIFTYLHATPLPRSAVGVNFLKEFLNAASPPSIPDTKVVAVFKELDGKCEFTQVNITHVELNFVLNKGITENDPEHYFIEFPEPEVAKNLTILVIFRK